MQAKEGAFLIARHELESGNMKHFMKTTRSALAVMTLLAADTNAGTQEQLAAKGVSK
jgi:hypothetical protein